MGPSCRVLSREFFEKRRSIGVKSVAGLVVGCLVGSRSWPTQIRSEVSLAGADGRTHTVLSALVGCMRSQKTVSRSKETLIYRWCRRCWSLSYELRDETT